MPQDTTIYWNRDGALPPGSDSFALEKQHQVLSLISPKKDEGYYSDPSGVYVSLVVFILVFTLAAFYSNSITRHRQDNHPGGSTDDSLQPPATISPPLVYSGKALKFNSDLISGVLTRRFPYYNALDEADKEKFIKRLQKFISLKTFVIHDDSGFKEMPILISATAIQLSFGLDKFLLPHFTTFNIYPAEFIGTYPFIRFLVGNVTGNTINLSWKHLLEGFQFHTDGQNVAMHELAHALYYQTFEAGRNVDKDFRDTFPGFNDHGNKVYEGEKENPPGLYSEYALKDFQEFWAESVEIFFEKPILLKSIYPDLYCVMRDLLNQDTAASASQNIT